MTERSALTSGPVGARRSVEALPSSKIRQVAHAGMDIEGVIPLWFGEPDVPTPDFINRAAAEALARGCTFYTPNRGIPELRETLARYMSGVHARPVATDRITVTASGMSAINLVQQVLTDPGDNVVVTAPVWPNIVETVRIMGGEPRPVPLRFGNDGWRLDLDQLLDRVDGRTRALLINSPSNPTGWMMEADQQRAVLDFCRQRGIWIIADEVYCRLAYDRAVAPSFIDLAEPEDRVLAINSFSKSWAMTGWRLGWIAGPPAIGPILEKMIEFHYSCPAHFTQLAGIAAVEQGGTFVAETVERYRQARDLAIDRLQAMAHVRVHRPNGAFYAFFAVEGMTDSLAACIDLLRRTRVGLAPGAAFGTAGEGYIRLCFASTPARLDEALNRLEPILS